LQTMGRLLFGKASGRQANPTGCHRTSGGLPATVALGLLCSKTRVLGSTGSGGFGASGTWYTQRHTVPILNSIYRPPDISAVLSSSGVPHSNERQDVFKDRKLNYRPREM
jgi:hypothetical protein